MTSKLKDVAAQYWQWRKQTGAKGRIPDYLRSQTLSLADTHSTKTVGEALGITPKTIQNWMKKTSCEPIDFISLNQNDSQDIKVPASISANMTLELPCGIKILLNDLDTGDTVKLISALSKELR